MAETAADPFGVGYIQPIYNAGGIFLYFSLLIAFYIDFFSWRYSQLARLGTCATISKERRKNLTPSELTIVERCTLLLNSRLTTKGFGGNMKLYSLILYNLIIYNDLASQCKNIGEVQQLGPMLSTATVFIATSWFTYITVLVFAIFMGCLVWALHPLGIQATELYPDLHRALGSFLTWLSFRAWILYTKSFSSISNCPFPIPSKYDEISAKIQKPSTQHYAIFYFASKKLSLEQIVYSTTHYLIPYPFVWRLNLGLSIIMLACSFLTLFFYLAYLLQQGEERVKAKRIPKDTFGVVGFFILIVFIILSAFLGFDHSTRVPYEMEVVINVVIGGFQALPEAPGSIWSSEHGYLSAIGLFTLLHSCYSAFSRIRKARKYRLWYKSQLAEPSPVPESEATPQVHNA